MKKIAMVTITMSLVAAAASAQVFVHEAGVHVSVETAPVSGAPYSAEATTESVQVLADGNRIVRRTTTEIAAGAIGNELPIVVTAEEWVSTDLKVLVLTRHADPRSGETTYRLTNIVRGEPAATLFEAPAGVTVK